MKTSGFIEAPSTSALHRLFSQRIALLDGAMGTMIQERGFGESDFRGQRFASHPRDLRGDNDLLSLTRPDVIEEIVEELGRRGKRPVDGPGETHVHRRDIGGDIAHEVGWRIAVQRVEHSAARPSFLTLPILDESDSKDPSVSHIGV